MKDREDKAVDVILSRFEEVLSDNLFRLVSVDEIDLWAAGWEILAPTEPASPPTWMPYDAYGRLRLARLLRMLLREGIPIDDRQRILEGFQLVEERGTAGPLEAVAEIRARLYPAIVGPDPAARVWHVPEDLEDRVAAGSHTSTKPVGLCHGARPQN